MEPATTNVNNICILNQHVARHGWTDPLQHRVRKIRSRQGNGPFGVGVVFKDQDEELVGISVVAHACQKYSQADRVLHQKHD